MKKLILALIATVATSSFAAACPSFDAAVDHPGSVATADALEAAICHMEAMPAVAPTYCSVRISMRQQLLVIMNDRFQVGEVTRTEVDATAKRLTDTIITCSTK